MTTGEMIAEVRATVAYDQDPVVPVDAGGIPVALSDARVALFLNRAVERLAELCRMRGTATLTTRAGVARYGLRGSDLSRPVRMVLRLGTTGLGSTGLGTTGGGAYWLSRGDEVPGLAPGVPARYAAFEREVVLSPPPASTTTYTVDAYVLPARIDAGIPTAACELPESLHLDACRWAAAELSRPNATEGQQRARLADEKTLAEGEALRLGRAAILAGSRAADVRGGRAV